MITIILGVISFSIILLLLTAFILFAESKLVSRKPVSIIVNNDKENSISTNPGNSLLSTLADKEIFLPSACGGGGTCGTCKCQVISGGGEILPVEQGFINKKLAQDNWRLACQVKVRQDMEVQVPDEIFSIKKLCCKVISNDSVATFIKEFKVELPPGEKFDFQPGSYVQIDIPQYAIDFEEDIEIAERYKDTWKKMGIYAFKSKLSSEDFRAYSMANYPAEGNIIMLNVRLATPPWDNAKNKFEEVPVGRASSYIFQCKNQDSVMISGPYGDFFIQDTDREMVYIGGGAGMAPLRSHIMHLFHTLKTKRKVSFWYGARSVGEIFYEDDFKKLDKKHGNFSFNVALSEPLPSDNWKGYTGFIHEVLYENYLKDHKYPEDIEYYLCGPPVMIAAVKQMLYDLGVEPEMILYDEF